MSVALYKHSLWYRFTHAIGDIRFFRWLFREGNYLLEQELKDCQSVLDIGCGNYSPIGVIKHLSYTVGVEPDKVALARSQKIKYITNI